MTNWAYAMKELGLTDNQAHVLSCFNKDELLSDKTLAYVYRAQEMLHKWKPQSDSGIRSRRSELVKLGLLVDSGESVRSDSGRHMVLWELH